ncbi:hypothetical protein [Sphingomicrobium sediminis]|uniref:Uncharacterized protein n=1 Tax=Sphingomicrobium sediminis TaxID=2950949 RepID=A0A9X2EH55_9SPHN|nr:hypothetical protein [Sphingomicrobium sediminis]MCM8557925.1 hypothetical protein [Sphingomicrobium sediminis]
MKLLILPMAFVTMGASDPATEPATRLLSSDTARVGGPQLCEEDIVHFADRDGAVTARPLGDLPRARVELAVWVTENGCTVPQVVKQDVEE